jgi:Zn finger protein HypA/HybF involved in hydrogenase expression
VEVGDDAGVEPESLAFCLEAVLATPPFHGAKPVITRLPGDVLRLSYLEVEDAGPND